jgi:hypothetical protein
MKKSIVLLITSLFLLTSSFVQCEEKVVSISHSQSLDSINTNYLSKGWTVKHVAGVQYFFVFVLERHDLEPIIDPVNQKISRDVKRAKEIAQQLYIGSF